MNKLAQEKTASNSSYTEAAEEKEEPKEEDTEPEKEDEKKSKKGQFFVQGPTV